MASRPHFEEAHYESHILNLLSSDSLPTFTDLNVPNDLIWTNVYDKIIEMYFRFNIMVIV